LVKSFLPLIPFTALSKIQPKEIEYNKENIFNIEKDSIKEFLSKKIKQ
jgi:hypothetical protein